MDLSVKESLQKSFLNFFTSLQGDGSALTSFLGTWSAISNTIWTHHESLQEDTLAAVHSMASMIDVVASDMINLDKRSHQILREHRSDISTIIEEGMEALSISNKSIIASEKAVSARNPNYIRLSYEWLLSNLHNPYPSKDTKQTISRQSKCPVKDIDAWFIDARKRIGWNKLRKTKFSNKQEKIIAAATHFFKPHAASIVDDADATLVSGMNPDDAYRPDFAIISSKARQLYADKFPELVSHITLSDIDYVVCMEKTEPTDNDDLKGCAYPTPEPSPPCYLVENVPLATSLSNEPQASSRKRPRSILHTSDDTSNIIMPRPRKRLRLNSNGPIEEPCIVNLPSPTDTCPSLFFSNAVAPTASIPSPSDTNDVVDSPSEDGSSELPTVAEPICSSVERLTHLSNSANDESPKHRLGQTIVETTFNLNLTSEVSRPKRKRRLSDGESQCSPKRPHIAFATPRLQTASNPLPMAKPYYPDLFASWDRDDNLFDLDFTDIPSLTALEDTFSLTPLDIFQGQYDLSITPHVPCLDDTSAYFVPYNVCTSTIPHETLMPFPEDAVVICDPDYLSTTQSGFTVNTGASPNFSDYLSASINDLPIQSTTFNAKSQQLQSTRNRPSCIQTSPLCIASKPLDKISVTDSDLKRAKIQALNEQIRQLEAEL